MDERPVIWCLVGYFCPPFGLMTARVVTLDEAVEYQRFGFAVLIDPEAEADFAAWEREQRALYQEERRKRKWFERGDA